MKWSFFVITFRLKVCIGRLKVSPMCLFFGSFGLLQKSHFTMKSLSQNNECFIICHKIFVKTINLPGRSVSSEALDEEGHGYNKANAHEKDAIPIGLKKNNLRGAAEKEENRLIEEK